MSWKIVYWIFIAFVAVGLGYVYLYREEIPLTRNFEESLDAQIDAMEKRKEELAEAVIRFEQDQKAERAFREEAMSNSYSNPFRALTKEWYTWQIVYLGILQLLFTYRVIFYLIAFLSILLFMRYIFWRYYVI